MNDAVLCIKLPTNTKSLFSSSTLQYRPKPHCCFTVCDWREMGKAEKERLNRILVSHLNTIHETFQVFDESPPFSMEKVSWEEVIQMAEQLSKQATMAGMLWNGQRPEVKAFEENMAAYVNVLQGFLLLSHGSTVGAGPTLSFCIHASVKQVVDSSFKLLKESVSSYGSRSKDTKLAIPQLVGAVWEACSALKKTPASNITAIGRAMTQVAVSLKDVLRELKELKPVSSDPTQEAADESSTTAEDATIDDNCSSIDDLGNDLSPEEMKVAQSAIAVVSDTVTVTKEIIRSITGLLKLEKPDNSGNFVNSLEKLLKLCQQIGAQIDELGACLYPPQEIPAMKAASGKISSMIDDMEVEIENLKGGSEAFVQACNDLKNSLRLLESDLDCYDTTDLVAQMGNVALSK